MGKRLCSILKALTTVIFVISIAISSARQTSGIAVMSETDFDYRYYADSYADLKAAFGYDKDALWNHYLQYGRFENRKCSPADVGECLPVTGNSVDDTASNDSRVLGASRELQVDDYSRLLFEKVNAYRKENNLSVLTVRDVNMQVANLRLNELPGKFDHRRPDGRTFGTAYMDLGYNKPYCGENLCELEGRWDFNKDGDINAYIQYIFDGYKASPSHNACMLNPSWNYIGSAFFVNIGNYSYNALEFSQ